MLKNLRCLCKGQILNPNKYSFTSRRLLFGSALVRNNEDQLAGKSENNIAEVSFSQLKTERLLSKELLEGLEKNGYKSLTPVQQKTVLPMLYEEKGLVCRAKTGTGKTLAFILPTLEYIVKSGKLFDPKTHVLVVAPTRDLAKQIEMEYENFISRMSPFLRTKLRVELCVGGHRQKKGKFGVPKIVIATPGRLNDNLDNPKYAHRFSDLAYRVYDEADRILDGGFADTLREIDIKLKECRQSKQPFRSVLFSATTDQRVADFAKTAFGPYYKFIDCVDKDEPEAHENIKQSLVITDDISSSFNGALEFVSSRLHDSNFKAIVFLPTINLTNWFHEVLLHSVEGKSRSFSKKHIYRLHGKLTQYARDKTMLEFRKLNQGVLVCTDIAARGINFPDVTCIVQMTPSVNIADYIHKIGRTGRAGASGESVLFSSKSEQQYVEKLRKQRKVEFARKDVYQTADGENSMIKNLDHFSQKELEEVLTSYLSYYAQIIPNYRINSTEILKEVVRFYRQMVGDEYAKLPVKRYLLGPAFQLSRNIKNEVQFR